jgi:hypothetical protein
MVDVPVGHDFDNVEGWGPTDRDLREATIQLRAVIVPIKTNSRQILTQQTESIIINDGQDWEVEDEPESVDDQFLLELEQVDYVDAYKDNQDEWDYTIHDTGPYVAVKDQSTLKKRRRIG